MEKTANKPGDRFAKQSGVSGNWVACEVSGEGELKAFPVMEKLVFSSRDELGRKLYYSGFHLNADNSITKQ